MSPQRRLVALALLAAACGARAPPQALVVALPSGPLSLQPNTINEEFTLSVQSNVFETLVDFDTELGLRPGLAESWVTLDDLTWVFRLRPGLRLHDGRLLQAGDVVRSLEHARGAVDSRRRLQLEPLQSVRALDARTLELRTKRAFDTLPSRLGNVFIWSPGPDDGQPVGTGPYRVREWSATGPTRLRAFDAYHGGAPPIAEVEFRVIADPSEQARELVAGRVHLLLDVAGDDLERLRSSPDVRVMTRGGLRVLFLGLDVARARSPHVSLRASRAEGSAATSFGGGDVNPLRDVRVRRALALAVDREGLVRQALGGLGEVVDQIAAPLEQGGVRPARHDLAMARRLLAEAGYADGFRLGLTFMPNKYRAMERVAAALSRDLALLGIELTPLPTAPVDMLRGVEQRALTCYVLGWISDIGDAVMSYEYLLHTPRDGFGVTNGGGYSNPRLDDLVLQASGRLTPRQRRERLAEAARIVREDVPLLPLYRQVDVYAASAALDFMPRLDRRVRVAALRFRP